MTDATNTTRKTAATVYDAGKQRAIIVTIKPKTIEFRAAGLKTKYSLPIERLYTLAIWAEIEDKKRIPKTTKRGLI